MEMTFKQLDSASYYKIQKNENEKCKMLVICANVVLSQKVCQIYIEER